MFKAPSVIWTLKARADIHDLPPHVRAYRRNKLIACLSSYEVVGHISQGDRGGQVGESSLRAQVNQHPLLLKACRLMNIYKIKP
jgi:hypothetical protein